LLFIATFTQLSAPRNVRNFGKDWLDGDFTAGHCPGVDASLRCAVRAEERRYRGCVLVEEGSHDLDLYSRIRAHIAASGYITFFCTLLINDAKVQYESDIADRAVAKLENSLEIRLHDAQSLIQARDASGKPCFSRNSIKALTEAQLEDRKLLDRFDQLVATCERNSEQFDQVASRLMEADNRWVADVRRRLRATNANLKAAQNAIRGRFGTVQAHLDSKILDEEKNGSEPPAQSVWTHAKKLLWWEGIGFVFSAGMGIGMLGIPEFGKAKFFFWLAIISVALKAANELRTHVKRWWAIWTVAAWACLLVFQWFYVLPWVDSLKLAKETKEHQEQSRITYDSAPATTYVASGYRMLTKRN
jgi:hypothetical protein